MAKKKTEETQHIPVVNETSLSFFEKYINNLRLPVLNGKARNLWLEYIKPYIDIIM
jgi:hypothetical protein